MTCSLLRAALTVGLVVGLATGCASGKSHHQAPPGDMQTVTTKDIENSSEPIEKTLEAKAPGLLVERTPDGNLALRIRGVSSLYGSNEPLYVIDGVPITAGPGGALTGVNPHDIETIKVLKDPADIGIYGIRGGNGVILITTKKPGRKPQET
jgi:TonB-dependent SusC/RagA subfamily outer membrane receptor